MSLPTIRHENDDDDDDNNNNGKVSLPFHRGIYGE
jgi:hypothetical protein